MKNEKRVGYQYTFPQYGRVCVLLGVVTTENAFNGVHVHQCSLVLSNLLWFPPDGLSALTPKGEDVWTSLSASLHTTAGASL